MDTIRPCKFGHEERYADGRCAVCKRQRAAQWGKNNPERRKEILRKYRETNPDQHRNWVAKNSDYVRVKNAESRGRNPETTRASRAAWRKNNLGRVAALAAKRRSAKLARTPSWLTSDDLWMIGEAYELAALRTEMFGFVWHVDHEIPLQGKQVSGLHIPLNLRVIPGIENSRKGASF